MTFSRSKLPGFGSQFQWWGKALNIESVRALYITQLNTLSGGSRNKSMASVLQECCPSPQRETPNLSLCNQKVVR